MDDEDGRDGALNDDDDGNDDGREDRDEVNEETADSLDNIKSQGEGDTAEKETGKAIEEVVEETALEEEPAGDAFEDLSWRVEKLRLEEANTARFLKARPRFLPYDECRKWVMAWGRWESEEEWRSWIEDGEKRNSYIPTRPDEYYVRMGQWRGWDHFLGLSSEGDDDSLDGEDEFQ
eukprot:CAMPEP_0197256052 /NCGR_PEP_ID=MMETSP1429-20130617/74064_1 /TAXON_ID=49237 /ORGANISM="Chaetoceros  sp., Strain UNC1202" /LENGTH=176 /DNA_ID=CAMNT_0042719509 /DNA_START=186 /DNA_END=719 /DNA_ORIENTATION=-